MSAVINQDLNKNILDFLIMQEISECKLNRILSGGIQNPSQQFYSNYLLNNKSFNNSSGNVDIDLLNQFKVVVGSIPSLNQNITEYEGGAGLYTKIPENQINDFIKKYTILDYRGNDSTGFSATIFKNNSDNQITISFRSTEFAEDFYKDAVGADTEINNRGTAIGQTASLVKYIEEMKASGVLDSTSTINITGYSLGGHLAANFYKMYANEFNIRQMYAFNSPGSGYLKTVTEGIDPYVELKNELKQYNVLSQNIFAIKNSLTTDSLPITLANINSALSNITSLTTEQRSYIDSYIAAANTNNQLESLFNKITETAIISNEVEDENNKQSFIDLNKDTEYLKTSIYSNDFYKDYVDYINKKYDSQKVSNVLGFEHHTKHGWASIPTSIFDGALLGDKTGYQKDSSFYGNKAVWISGIGTVNFGDVWDNDFNLVANSNYYSNPLDIVIEDRVEAESNLGRLPIGHKFTADNKGDFGNTHSITLLNKSLSLMTFLANIEGQSTINVAKYSGIISASTTEKAAHWIGKTDTNKINEVHAVNYGDANSIALIVNQLYEAVIGKGENTSDVVLENTAGGWADINKINDIQVKQSLILNELVKTNTVVQLESLYNFKTEDLNKGLNGFLGLGYKYKSKEDIYNSAMQDTPEGMAYRYAIENLNAFVIKGLDYSTIDFKSKDKNQQTETWYKTRIDILLEVVKANVNNNGDYLAQTTISVDDKNQGLKFHTLEEKFQKEKFYKTMREIELNNGHPTSTVHVNSPNEPVSYYQNYSSKFHYSGAVLNKIPGYSWINNVLDIFRVSREGITDSIKGYLTGFNIKDNIYYLNPLASSFISRRRNDNEKIFIQPDEAGMYAIRDQYIYHYDYQLGVVIPTKNAYMTEDGKITSIVNLQSGNDYIEIKSSFSEISSSGGKKDYNLSSIKTIIDDPKKTGSITLDGILLNGGKYTADKKKKVQTETVNDEVINIIYAVVSGQIVITNEKTQHQVIIKNTSGLDDKMFGFQSTKHVPFKEKWYKPVTNVFTTNALRTSDSMTTNEDIPEESALPENTITEMDMSKFFNNTQEFTDFNVTLSNTYNSQQDFSTALLINAGITSDSVSYRNDQDLIIYNKTDPSDVTVIKNMFNINGTLKQYQANIQNGYDNNGNPLYYTAYGNLNVNGLNNINYSNLQLSDYVISVNNAIMSGVDTIIEYKGNTKLAINDTAFKNIAISQEGNNLVFSNLELDNPGKLIINNYFNFDHSTNTNIFTGYNQYNPEQSLFNQVPVNNLYSLLSIKFTEDNDIFVATENSASIVLNGGAGDDVIGGSSRDEIFISSGIRDNNGIVGWDGDDLLNGGGGADTFVFSENSGYDTITDFGNDDKIFIKSDYTVGNSQFKYNIERENNDLILQIGNQAGNMYNNNSFAVTAQIRVLNYFATIDYKADTRIYYFPQGMTGDSNSALPPTLVFNQQDFTKINDIVVSGGILNQNNTHAKNLTANDEDNTITITKNDTVVLEHSLDSIYGTYMPNDGNDTFIIDINEPEPDQLVRNQFRTEIGFSLYGGQDVINGGEFKKENEYGDIVRIKDLDASEIVFNTIEVNGNLESINVTLSDGSTMVVKVTSDTPFDAAIFKLDDQILTLENIYNLIETTFITADNNDNQTFNISNSYRDSYIQTFDGEDTIYGGHANDNIYTGKGDDKVFLSSGKDTYIFLKGDGIDSFVFKEERELFDATFVVDVNFNPQDIKYYFNPNQNKIYLAFSAYEGVVFENSDWTDILYLRQSLKIEDLDGNPITISNEINDVTSSPFIAKPVETISGTTRILKGNESNDTLVATPQHNNIILGNDGNDTIIGNNVSSMRSIIFGGKGDDNITADYIDIVTVKDGDGHDTINANYQYYLLNILHNETRTDQFGEQLFNLSANNNDLNIIYNDSRESVTLANFFNNDGSIVGNIGVSIYNKDKDQMTVHYLPDLLNMLGITKTSLNNSEFILNNDLPSYWTSPENSGYILGGEISYQYLLTGDYQITNNTNNVMTQINNNNTFLPKI